MGCFFLVVQWLKAISRNSRGPAFCVNARKPEIFEGAACPKRKPGHWTGHLVRAFAVQYSQKMLKNNGLFDNWLADFGRKNAGFAILRSGLVFTEKGVSSSPAQALLPSLVG
jgi:hypothetical protein